jgi:hypothetical protein
MTSMKLPRLTLLVAMYVSLDVANPLMPGALSFRVEESVEARQVDRFRGHDDVSTLPLAPASEPLAPVEPRATRSRVITAVGSYFWRAHDTRSDPSLRPPAPAPEDH